jgi:hypothetical protein
LLESHRESEEDVEVLSKINATAILACSYVHGDLSVMSEEKREEIMGGGDI